ncbi:hypothetical protein BSK58_29310, partial [Paenibacillus odorifer]
SRTRPLSPPAPMVLGPKGPGRVGRCQAHEAIVDLSTMAFLFPLSLNLNNVDKLWGINEIIKVTNMWMK